MVCVPGPFPSAHIPHILHTSLTLFQVLAERAKDPEDLAARALPFLSTKSPLDAWSQVLGREDAVTHPR